MFWVKKVKEFSMILGVLNLRSDYGINIIQNLQHQKAGFWKENVFTSIFI